MRHFVTLIEICMHLIRVNPGHISTEEGYQRCYKHSCNDFVIKNTKNNGIYGTIYYVVFRSLQIKVLSFLYM